MYSWAREHIQSLVIATMFAGFIVIILCGFMWYGYTGKFTPHNQTISCTAINASCFEYVLCAISVQECAPVCPTTGICYINDSRFLAIIVPIIMSLAWFVFGVTCIIIVLRRHIMAYEIQYVYT